MNKLLNSKLGLKDNLLYVKELLNLDDTALSEILSVDVTTIEEWLDGNDPHWMFQGSIYNRLLRIIVKDLP